MDISRRRGVARRRAISAILGTIIMFAALIAAGLGFFLFVNQSILLTSQADAARQASLVQASLERLQVEPRFSSNQLWLTLNDTGGATATVIAVYVTSMKSSRIISNSSQNTPYLTRQPDLNINLPLAVAPGVPTNRMTGCGAGSGCDIALAKSKVNNYNGTGPIVISVLTSTGNVFSALYPPNPKGFTTTTTVTESSVSTTIIPGGSPSSNILIVQMVATPPLAFSCTSCVNDTVTVYNYGNLSVTNVALSPAIPSVSATGTAGLPNGHCTLENGTNTIPAYVPPVGVAHHIIFVCTYDAVPGAVGGYATFAGAATGMYGVAMITSAISISNAIQVGGSSNILSQGPFTANFFLFKYTACTNAPPYGSTCATDAPYPFGSPSSLPSGNLLNGGSVYYVAYYVRLTNGFNTTMSILPYSYFEADTTTGSESAFFLVGSPNVGAPTYTPYYPNYNPPGLSHVPTLTAYSPSVSQCISNPANCIQVEPGRSVTLTFASCGIIPVPQNNWDWGGIQYGDGFDSLSCLPNNAPCFNVAAGQVTNANCPPTSVPISTYTSIVVSFLYKGQVYTQQIPFVGMIVL